MPEKTEYIKPARTERGSLEDLERSLQDPNPPTIAALYHAGVEGFREWPQELDKLYNESLRGELPFPTSDLIPLLLESLDKITKREVHEDSPQQNEIIVRNLLVRLLENHLNISTNQLGNEQYKSRKNKDGSFWSELLPDVIRGQIKDENSIENSVNKEAQKIIETINLQDGATLYDKYLSLRRSYYETTDPETEVESIISFVEGALSRQNAEVIFEAVKTVKELGLSVDQFIQLRTGMSLDDISSMMESVSAKFNYSDQEIIPYEDRLHSTLYKEQEIDNTSNVSSALDVDSILTQKDLRILTLEGSNLTPQYFIIPSLPNIDELTSDEELRKAFNDSELYKQIKVKAPVLVVLSHGEEDSSNPNDQRTSLHEKGHILAASFDLSAALLQNPLLGEIPSVLMEFFHPNPGYIRDAQFFLTTRYAGLGKHEAALWQAAEQVVDGRLEKNEFYRMMEESYMESYGNPINSEIISSRWGTDSLANIRVLPFRDTASYAIAGVIAPLILNELILAQTESDDKNPEEIVIGIYTQLAEILRDYQTPEELIKKLHLSAENFNEAVEKAVQWYKPN